jgi:hypothetical protein
MMDSELGLVVLVEPPQPAEKAHEVSSRTESRAFALGTCFLRDGGHFRRIGAEKLVAGGLRTAAFEAVSETLWIAGFSHEIKRAEFDGLQALKYRFCIARTDTVRSPSTTTR